VLPELGWLAERALRVLFVALCTPVIWALLFATAAVMSANLFGGSGFIDKLFLHPLATVAMFVLALLIPLMLLRHTHGGYGRQPVGMLAGYAGLRLAAGAVSMRIPAQLGGRKPAPATPQVQTVLTRDRDGRTSVLERLSVNPADPAGQKAALTFAGGRMPGQAQLADLLAANGASTVALGRNGGQADGDGSAGRAQRVELLALPPNDAGQAGAAGRALAEARRATPTITQGRSALTTLSGNASRQIAAQYHERGYEHAALTLAHNSRRDALGAERQQALGTLAGLSEPQLQHVLGQTPPLAQNPAAEEVADLQRAEGLFSARPPEAHPTGAPFSAAAPTPATAELQDLARPAGQPTSDGAHKPAAARSTPGNRARVPVSISSREASPPSDPPPTRPPRPQTGGER
jgi:hypothetical protein